MIFDNATKSIPGGEIEYAEFLRDYLLTLFLVDLKYGFQHMDYVIQGRHGFIPPA